MKLNEKIQYLRTISKQTKYDLSVKSDIDLDIISAYEDGTEMPTADMLKKIAALYNVSLESLTNDELELEFLDVKIEKKLYGQIDNKKEGIVIGAITGAVILIWGIISLLFIIIMPVSKYSKAIDLLDDGEYSKASKELENFNYLDSVKIKTIADALDKISYDDIWEAELTLLNADCIFNFEADAEPSEVILSYGKLVGNKIGYRFIRWDITNVEYDLDDYEVTVYAKPIYEMAQYSIYYNLDGGTLKEDKDIITFFETVSILNPTKEGYEFLGWTYGNVSTPIKDLKLSNIYYDILLKAHWEKLEDSGSEVA